MDDSVKEIISRQIESNKDFSIDEKFALGRELEAASKLNGEDGKLGEALKQSIYGTIVFRCGEKGRIEEVVNKSLLEHTSNCKFKGDNTFGCLNTKWGTLNGFSLIVFIVISGILIYLIGPNIAKIWRPDIINSQTIGVIK